MLPILFAFFHVFAAETLDHAMTPQEQKKTGVYKLSDKQKAELQKWIDTFYAKRSEPLYQGEATAQRSLLQDNLENGRYLRLANGSSWQIRPEDTNISQGWITPVDIIVSKTDDPLYPYQLTNSVTGSSIRAKKAPSRTE